MLVCERKFHNWFYDENYREEKFWKDERCQKPFYKDIADDIIRGHILKTLNLVHHMVHNVAWNKFPFKLFCIVSSLHWDSINAFYEPWPVYENISHSML